MLLREARPLSLEEDRGREEAVVEVGLLLCSRQLAALEVAAYQRGLTAGGLVRRLISEFLGSTGRSRGQG
jgi:hypothetical protein